MVNGNVTTVNLLNEFSVSLTGYRANLFAQLHQADSETIQPSSKNNKIEILNFTICEFLWVVVSEKQNASSLYRHDLPRGFQ